MLKAWSNGDQSNLFRYAKRGENTSKSKLKLRETSLTDVMNTYCWTWQQQVFKLKYKEVSSFKHTLDSSSSSTWKRPRGSRQFSHLFIGWKGPRDDKTQNTHVLNSRASLGTSGNKMADKLRGLQLVCHSFDQFYSGVVHNQDEG